MLRKMLAGVGAAVLMLAMAGAASAQVTLTASYGAATLAAPGPATLTFTITNNTASALTTTTLNYINSSPTSFAGGTSTPSCGLSSVITASSLTLGIYVDRGPQTIPANSTCTITGSFTAAAGTHVLSSPTMTFDGGGSVTMTAGAIPTMIVAPVAPAAPVPTLSEWGLILMGLILAGGAALMVQRRFGQA